MLILLPLRASGRAESRQHVCQAAVDGAEIGEGAAARDVDDRNREAGRVVLRRCNLNSPKIVVLASLLAAPGWFQGHAPNPVPKDEDGEDALVDARHNFGDARLDAGVLAEVSDISDVLLLTECSYGSQIRIFASCRAIMAVGGTV